jgi:hypothetical protein
LKIVRVKLCLKPDPEHLFNSRKCHVPDFNFLRWWRHRSRNRHGTYFLDSLPAGTNRRQGQCRASFPFLVVSCGAAIRASQSGPALRWLLRRHINPGRVRPRIYIIAVHREIHSANPPPPSAAWRGLCVGPKLSQQARSRARPQATSPPEGDRRDSQPRGIHNRNRSRENTAGGFSSHSPMDRNRRGNRADLDNLGIHSPEDRSRRGILSSLGTHSPAARSRDSRSRDIHRLGSRNRCRVAEVVYLRLLRIYR